MTALEPFGALDARSIALTHEDVPGDQTVSGSPRTASEPLASIAGVAEVGIWEMTTGSMRDIEVDEVFVVIAGEATVVLQGDDPVAPIQLSPGVVCRLAAGMSTRWDVTKALRKVYILGAPAKGTPLGHAGES